MWLIVIAPWLKILRTSGTESIRKTCGPPPPHKTDYGRPHVYHLQACQVAEIIRNSRGPGAKPQALERCASVKKLRGTSFFVCWTNPASNYDYRKWHAHTVHTATDSTLWNKNYCITPREIDAPSPGVMYFGGVMTELGRRCRVKSNSLMRPTSRLGPFHSAGLKALMLTTSFVGRAKKLGKDSVIRLQSN